MRNSIRVKAIAESCTELCDHCQRSPATGIKVEDGSYICLNCCPEQVAQAWDDDSYPWPYRYRPCFMCGVIATSVYDGFAFCEPCETEVIADEQAADAA